jgi:hypothetical protein
MLQNFLLFQAGWFACVLGGASRDYTWVGVVIVTLIVAVHLARAENVRNETILIMITAFLGAAWDSTLMVTGLFSFTSGVVFPVIVPLWMIAMWALFATTLNVSMKWMKGRYLLAILFGAIGGPVAYYAGHRLGAVEFSNTWITLFTVAVGWSVIMPALMMLTNRFNGYQAVQSTAYEVKTT